MFSVRLLLSGCSSKLTVKFGGLRLDGLTPTTRVTVSVFSSLCENVVVGWNIAVCVSPLLVAQPCFRQASLLACVCGLVPCHTAGWGPLFACFCGLCPSIVVCCGFALCTFFKLAPQHSGRLGRRCVLLKQKIHSGRLPIWKRMGSMQNLLSTKAALSCSGLALLGPA